MKYGLIEAEKTDSPIAKQCAWHIKDPQLNIMAAIGGLRRTGQAEPLAGGGPNRLFKSPMRSDQRKAVTTQ